MKKIGKDILSFEDYYCRIERDFVAVNESVVVELEIDLVVVVLKKEEQSTSIYSFE